MIEKKFPFENPVEKGAVPFDFTHQSLQVREKFTNSDRNLLKFEAEERISIQNAWIRIQQHPPVNFIFISNLNSTKYLCFFPSQ